MDSKEPAPKNYSATVGRLADLAVQLVREAKDMHLTPPLHLIVTGAEQVLAAEIQIERGSSGETEFEGSCSLREKSSTPTTWIPVTAALSDRNGDGILVEFDQHRQAPRK